MIGFFSKANMLRIGLALAAIAVILTLLPRADHQSFTYEVNQPWRYPLLTADFDTPILRDSASARRMRDSIDREFVPFVKRLPEVGPANIERLRTLLAKYTTAPERELLVEELENTYRNGIIDAKLYEEMVGLPSHELRLVETGGKDSRQVAAVNASRMLSPARAFTKIDSVFSHRFHNTGERTSVEVGKALNICILPNVVLDSAIDYKYRSQEYLTVTGAMGVIKKGQRIVDRGEIVSPQIATVLNTYLEMNATRKSNVESHTYYIVGQGIYMAIVFTILYMFLSLYRATFYKDLRKMVFLVSFITLFVLFEITMLEYFANGIYIVPFAAVPVILLVFFDSRTAIFGLITTILIGALAATYQYQFIFMQLVAGLAATFSIRTLSRRIQLVRSALVSFIAYVLTSAVLCILSEGNLSNFSFRITGIFAINSVLMSFAYILILVMEKIFGFTSTVTLVELSDINSPLLRKLAEDAPGTFQHSIQVSTLAAEAARAIGANTTLVRTGALYHDIGKLKSPIFFTENQHGINPHAGLDPETSAHKIISHVTEGISMASKEKLPAVIKDFISEHHGRGVAKFFYTTACNDNPDKVVDIEKFRYPGPNPRSKETAILMMADAVEAASRSLKEYTPDAINNLVDKIIDTQIADGLLKDSPISFSELETIKQTFKKRLSNIYHSRVSYPEMNKKTASAEANAKI